MTLDPLTLYKLMILHMLKQAKLPLTFSQLSEFLVGREYTDAFTLQQALSDLMESHLVRAEVNQHRSSYELTREGEEALVYFGKDISEGIISDIDTYLQDNKVRFRNEVGCYADYVKSDNNNYLVTCEIREGRNVLIRLELSAPTRKQAQIMCDNWQQASQNIYAYAMKTLLSDS